jgi:outer membrane protein insertion porin family
MVFSQMSRITATRIEGTQIDLDIWLQEPPRLSVLNITGLKRSELKEIEEKIRLRTGSIITDNTINNTRDIIRRIFC